MHNHEMTPFANAQLLFLKENKYPQHYCNMIDAKATSDDEPDPTGLTIKGSNFHHIRKHPEHSEEVETWIQLLNKKWEEDVC